MEHLVRTFYVTCSTEKKRQITRFRMVVDTPTCTGRAKRLRAVMLPWRVYRSESRMRVDVAPGCMCPCHSNPGKDKNQLFPVGVDPNNGTRLVLQRKNWKCKDARTFLAFREVSRCHNDLCSLSPYAPPCSGHGVCMCGTCVCDPGYTGLLCECRTSSCPQADGLVCGGPTRGVCSCAGCRCLGGRGGAACQLEAQDVRGCMEHGHDLDVCSGRGVCADGQCTCPVMFTGRYCETLDQCPFLRHCVRCFLTALSTPGDKPFLGGVDAFSCGDPTCDRCASDPSTRYTLLPLKVTEGHQRMCEFLDEAGCSYSFTYVQTSHVYDHETIIHVNETVVCTENNFKQTD